MTIWVLLRRAFQGDELVDAFRNSPEVFEAIETKHPKLLADSWRKISPQEFYLSDPRVDPGATFSLLRTEI